MDDEQDIWNCNLPYLPLSLDNTEYTEVPGYIHFNDAFLLDGRNVSFTVTQQSLMRVAIVGVGILSHFSHYAFLFLFFLLFIF